MSFENSFLENGAEVLTEPMSHVRSVTLGFWVKTGSRDEPESLSGISHFLEHLLFKGTKTRTAKEISETFDGLGAELNAFTGKEHTCYYTRIIDENLNIAVEVLSDMLLHSALNKDDIKSEKEVVLEEIGFHEDSPDERVHDLFAEGLWENHPLGKNILGHLDTVRNFERKDLTEYLKRQYTPENMLVTAAGNLKHEDLVNIVQSYLKEIDGDLPHKEKIATKIESRIKTIYKETEQAHICYGFESLPAGHDDRYALSILDSVLGGGMSSRLFQEIREKRGLAYSVYSYHSYYKDTGSFTIYAGTRPLNAEKVLELVKKEINKIVKTGIAGDELDRAKSQIKGQLILSLESTGNRMMRMGRSRITHGEVLSLSELIKRVDAVELKDVQRVARDIFLPEKAVLAVVGPFKEDKFEI
ncbi:MAG TPA: insulinase family protein [Actinobacteria bacterium]|nr:insulinase family protein [Actinomycetota bacterium]